MIAVEAIMENIAKHLGENKELWKFSGLLHDIDFEKTEDNPNKHTILAEKILKNFDVPKKLFRAIKAHNYSFNSFISKTAPCIHHL